MSKLPFLLLALTTLAQAAPSAQGVVHTPDADLVYFTYGAPEARGTPVVVVNGGPGFSHQYMVGNGVWERIGTGRPVIFYDQRGVGESKLLNPHASHSMEAYVADIDAIRVKLGYPKINLLGDSFGGFLAMGYAARHPEHISSLTLVDSTDAFWGKSPYLFHEVFPDLQPRDPKTGKQTDDALVQDAASTRTYLSMIFYSKKKFEDFMANLPPGVAVNHEIYDAIGAQQGNINLRPELRKFKFPCLIINGRWDMNEPMITAWRTHKAIAGSQLVIFDESGHLPFYEEQDKFVQVVEEFLSGDEHYKVAGAIQ